MNSHAWISFSAVVEHDNISPLDNDYLSACLKEQDIFLQLLHLLALNLPGLAFRCTGLPSRASGAGREVAHSDSDGRLAAPGTAGAAVRLHQGSMAWACLRLSEHHQRRACVITRAGGFGLAAVLAAPCSLAASIWLVTGSWPSHLAFDPLACQRPAY